MMLRLASQGTAAWVAAQLALQDGDMSSIMAMQQHEGATTSSGQKWQDACNAASLGNLTDAEEASSDMAVEEILDVPLYVQNWSCPSHML